MKKLLMAFGATILITLLFSLTGESLIIMYAILLLEAGIIVNYYKVQLDTKNDNKIINNEPKKIKETTKQETKIIKPSYTKCKEKVKIKKLEHKR